MQVRRASWHQWYYYLLGTEVRYLIMALIINAGSLSRFKSKSLVSHQEVGGD